MKTPLLYGFAMALGGALVWLGVYFAGLHDSVEKFNTSQWISGLLGLAITVVCLVLAMREKRADSSPENDWGYGSAFGVGVLTILVGSLLGAVTTYLYCTVINPNYLDISVQAQLAGLEAKGKSASEIAQAEPFIRKFSNPMLVTIFSVVFGFIFGLICTAIVAIFFRKRDEVAPALPPTLA